MNATRMVEQLKAEGKFNEAGRLAFESGLQRNYGCHYGMSSTRQADMAAFYAGYDAARDESKRPSSNG